MSTSTSQPLSARKIDVSMIVYNFGRNLSFTPEVHLAPRTEDEVLQLLAEHRGKRVRVGGWLHSWSEAARSDEIFLDLRTLNQVRTEQRAEGIWATAQGGCQIKKLLVDLEHQANATLPSIGLITEQTIAGAISTGTHGSGKNCISHYMSEIRLATYDPTTGEPVIRTITEGPELDAARCSLGCLGVILSVGFWARPQYMIEEHFAKYDAVEEVLVTEEQYPLQQFYFIPWLWNFYAQHRREVSEPRGRNASLYRFYCFWNQDIFTHLCIMSIARIVKSRRLAHTFFRKILPAGTILNWRVVDRSHQMLTMKHEIFRHIEIEVFARRSRLPDALAFVKQLLEHCDGNRDAFTQPMRDQLIQLGLWDSLQPLRGRFTYHYVVCIRKVFPDQTMMSMTNGGDEPYYAMSFISYASVDDRQAFLQFAKCLADCLAALYDVRPHWGKVCPLTAAQVAKLYPRLSEFRRVARQIDPHGTFQNDWISRVIFEEVESNGKA